jgi:hypothetical protein
MFHPVDRPMERGWVGRIDGDHVVQLAAQTLESFFTGGGTAREHAVYPLDAVRLLPPVLHPPSIRVFESETSFTFANPAAIVGPDAIIRSNGHPLALLPRLAGVAGLDGALAGFTCLADWRRLGAQAPKDRDFALGLGPVVVTPDDMGETLAGVVRIDGEERLRTSIDGFDWSAARGFAAQNTVLRPGDLLAAPELGSVVGIRAGDEVELEIDSVGTLRSRIQQASSR